MKHLISIIFATTLAGQVWAYSSPNGGLSYSIGATAMVTYQNEYSSNNYYGLKTLIIPPKITYNGNEYVVTKIGEKAFHSCYSLEIIFIPNTIEFIGYNAFYSYNATTYCEVESRPTSWLSLPPNNNVVWNAHLLNGMIFKITSDTPPYTASAVKYIGDSISFEIPSVILVDSIEYKVVEIGEETFSGCENLESVTIPNTIKSIGSNAFSGCSKLSSITMGNSVVSIGNNAFDGCSELSSITISESVTRVGSGVFSGCDKLDYNVFDNGCYVGNDENPYMVLFMPKKQDITSCAVHNKCKIISGSAFSSCSNLATVTIPESVATIGNGAFNGCNSLTNAEFASISSLCGIVFENYDANPLYYVHRLYIGGKEMTELSIPNTVTAIGNYAFSGCNNLKSLFIPNSVKSIGVNAFDGCKSLKSLTIPKNVEYVGDNAFNYCDSLTAVTTESNADFSKTAITFKNGDLRYKVLNKETVEVYGATIASIFNYGEGGLGNTYITIPTIVTAGNTYNVVSIGASAFYGKRIESITIANTIKSIGTRAFASCANLRTVTIPESVLTIDTLAFDYCNYIETLNFNTNAIGAHFAGKTSLKTLHIGEAVTSISTNSFNGCDKLVNVISAATTPPTLPDGDPFIKADTIYVKAESVEAYQTAPYWKRKVILPYTPITIKNAIDTVGAIKGNPFILGEKGTTLTAIPAQGYHFTKWYDGNTDNPRKFTTATNAEITASFEKHTIVVDSAVAATCSATGLTEGSHCSVCGMVIKEQISIGMTSHHWVVDSAVAVTCTTTGLSEGSHCDVCGFVRSRQYEYPALGHEFSNYVYNNDATTIADGTETATCWRCGETDTRVAQGTKLATAISEPAANNLQVYAHGNTIIVENATEEIRVYNAMGALVDRDVACRVRAEINVNGAGVYIVKVGYVTKRVMVN